MDSVSKKDLDRCCNTKTGPIFSLPVETIGESVAFGIWHVTALWRAETRHKIWPKRTKLHTTSRHSRRPFVFQSGNMEHHNICQCCHRYLCACIIRFCVRVFKVDPTYSLVFLLDSRSTGWRKVQVGTSFETNQQKSRLKVSAAQLFLRGLTVSLSWTISNAAFETLLKWFGSVENVPPHYNDDFRGTSTSVQSKYWQILWQWRTQGEERRVSK